MLKSILINERQIKITNIKSIINQNLSTNRLKPKRMKNNNLTERKTKSNSNSPINYVNTLKSKNNPNN